MNNAIPAEIEQRTVKVCGGSGVLVPAMSTAYSYVLTAFHNLFEDPEDPATRRPDNEIVVTLIDGSSFIPTRIIPSEQYDVAVLVVDGLEAQSIAITTEVRVRQPMWFTGYPEIRRADAGRDGLRPYPGHVEWFDNTTIDVSTNAFAGINEVRGSSGGGIYTEADGQWLLIAIEYRMEGRANETHNSLRGVRIGIFEQLIIDSGLAPILPPFMRAFAQLFDAIFPFPGFECTDSKAHLQTILKKVAMKRIGADAPTPHVLMEKLGERLLVKGDPLHSLTDRKLWISWLELHILCALIDKAVIDSKYVDDLRRNRMLLYSGFTGEWTDLLQQIVLSDFEGLAEGGIVLVSNNSKSPPQKARSSRDISKIVDDIGQSVDEFFDIGVAKKRVLPRGVMHLDGLHRECVIEKETDYLLGTKTNTVTILNSLTEAYRAAFA